MESSKTNDDFEQYYELSGLIGQGQYGDVFKAKDKKTKEDRAIKIIRLINDQDNNFIKYIENEIKTMKICSENNENSVKYYEHFCYKNKIVLVMELCDKSLQNILEEKKVGFTCEEIFNIMNQLNNTFRIMNKHNIIHRDIKLENILVKFTEKKDSNINFTVKLTDYGISKQLSYNTIGRTNLGTPLTMAPEILEGENEYDNKCDLWSIGIIIYQLFFKEYPFKGATTVAIYKQIQNFENKLLKKTNNANLDNLIMSLLKRQPNQRINYENYFEHPFFKDNLNKLKIIQTSDDKKEQQKIVDNKNVDKDNKKLIADFETINTISGEKKEEQIINNFKNKKLITEFEIKCEYIHDLIELQDGRISILKETREENEDYYYLSVYNINKNNNCDIDVKIDERLFNIIQLDDGKIIISCGRSIKLIQLFDKTIEIIQKEEDSKIYISKLDNGIIANYNKDGKTLRIYSYENDKLIFQKESDLISKKVITIEGLYGINQNEIIISYYYSFEFIGFFIRSYLAFYNHINKKIKYLKIDGVPCKGYFIDTKKLILLIDNKIVIIDLNNYTIKKKIKFDNRIKDEDFMQECYTIFFLSEKIILFQEDGSPLSIYKNENESKVNREFADKNYIGHLEKIIGGNKFLFFNHGANDKKYYISIYE